MKPFATAKTRLSDLEAEARASLVEDIAARTLEAARAAGHLVAVVSDDGQLRKWALQRGVDAIPEPADEPTSLDNAARAGVKEAHKRGLRWAIVHGDLPLVTEDDLRSVAEGIPAWGILLAPSYDGGTNVLAGDRADFPFAYGPGSFRRHLSRSSAYPMRVLVRRGLALDLDSAQDLIAAGLA